MGATALDSTIQKKRGAKRSARVSYGAAMVKVAVAVVVPFS